MSERKQAELIELYLTGHYSIADLAATFEISPQGVYRALRSLRLSSGPVVVRLP